MRRGWPANMSGMLKVRPGACRISSAATSCSTSATRRDTLSASLCVRATAVTMAAQMQGCLSCGMGDALLQS